MSEYNRKEYLEKIISFVKPKRAEDYAQRLEKNYDTLEDLLIIDRFLLSDTLGGDADVANYIRLISALTSRRITDKYKNGKKYSHNTVKEYIVGIFFGAEVENVYALLFDGDDKLISTEVLSDGTVNASGFLPRKLLDVAVRKNAKKVILAHNHPRGNTEPSSSDIAATYLAKSVLTNVGIELTHHYIAAGFDIEDCLYVAMSDADNMQKRLAKALVSAPPKKKGREE